MENYRENFENEQELSLQDYLRVLYGGRFIILASFLAVLVSTAIFTFMSEPVFEAGATILVEDERSVERALFDVNYLSQQSTMIANQVEILKSRTLAERVVQSLEAAPYRDSLEIFQPLSDDSYLVMREQADWLMAHLTITPRQESDVIELRFSAGSAFEAAEICNVITRTYQQLNKEYNLSEFKELREFLEFQLNKKNEELRKSEEELRTYRENRKLVALDESTRELITRVAEAQAQLEASLVEMEANQEQKRSFERQLEDRRKTMAVEVTQISSPLLQELQKEFAKVVNEKVKYETLLAQEPTIDPKVYSSQIQSLKSRIEAVQMRLQEEAERIANTSMVADPLEIAQSLIKSILEIETRIKGGSAKINALRDVVSHYDRQLELLPAQGLDLARLERQVEVDKNTYILLTQKLEETRITEAGQKETIRVVDRAIEPEYPVSPKKARNLLLGAILGLGLGIGLTFLTEYLDNSIKNPEVLERMKLSVLAIIPEISEKEALSKAAAANGHGKNGKTLSLDKPSEARLITHIDPKSPVSEAFRTLRTNIQFQQLKAEDTTLMVTSSTPKEGKSTTIANLAITMAQMGGKTLLVDTDLRRPVVHSIFNEKKDRGITNFLMGKMEFDDVVKPTFVDNLYIVSSGPLPPNPSELLASDEMDEFIRQAKEKFDLVLFDSPPIIAVTDAAILSTKLGGVIVVIKAHQTDKNAVMRAKSLLDNVNANIVGCLLNGVNLERSYGSYYYHYYYQYYSYYGHDLKRKKSQKA